MQSSLDFREAVAGGQDRVKSDFIDGAMRPLQAIRHDQMDRWRCAPEPGSIEEGRDASGVLT